MIGVIGWWAAIARRPARMVSTGTKALDRYGRKSTTKVAALAPSTVVATSPTHTDAQVSASTNSSSRPAAASHSAGPASGRKPVRYATPTTRTVASVLRATLATTWPMSTAELRIGIDRNRSTMPSSRSRATSTAVDAAP